MKKTHHGSCQCGAVRFECELALSAGTVRCNCSGCRKARYWMVFVKAAELRVLSGDEALADYQWTPPGKPGPFLHFRFCKTCGTRPFTKGGVLPQFDGEFYAVNVACLDDVTDEELVSAPIHFADGRNDKWDATAAVHAYL